MGKWQKEPVFFFNYRLTRINQDLMRLTLIPFECTPSRDPRTLLSVGFTPYRSITSHTPMVWTFVEDSYPLPEAGTKGVCHCTWVGRALKIIVSPRDAALVCISKEKHLPTGVILILPLRNIHSSDRTRMDSFALLPSLWI